ncbi:MAG TPA: Asp-tRNA(Asn)/Glu-tRNA(Gln) amidotransferase subunit GatC [Actinomycetales bacterium]|nr:Asp-tRNA(Asn)/Glu-tRNA(Gln) amidotransferase subunit GatC [Actinomycetales bacterium]
MSAITRDEVKHLAALAQIDLTDAEITELTDRLSAAIEVGAKVSEVAASAGEVSAMSHSVATTNNLRPDNVEPSLPVDDALAAAPAVEEERFVIPQIMGEEP